MNLLPAKFLTVALLAVYLSGCAKGLDKPLVTSAGIEHYKLSLAEASKDMSESDNEAFNWAVSDLTIDAVNARYPNQTPRKIVQGEVKNILDNTPNQIKDLEKALPAWNVVADDLKKIVCSETKFVLEKDFFGLQPRIKTTVSNGSRYGLSSLKWRLELFLDGADKPTAVAEQFDSYKDLGGLAPGASVKREFTVGFVKGDDTWTTLEIQNAKQRVVKLTIVPEGSEDFGERLIIGPSPAQRLEGLKKTLATAEHLKNL